MKPNLPGKLTTLLFYSAIFVFIVALAFPHNPAGNWYQQFMPNIGGRTITDITFIDSLTGYCITSPVSDTSYILKTTNKGDNWTILYDANGFIMNSIQFFDQNTGYVGGTHIIKTTDGGNSWSLISPTLFLEDFYFISIDTGWFVKSNSLTGGVFRTTNGGASWQNQLNIGSNNPNHVYMFNQRIGFISNNSGTYLRKTTNSGLNWDTMSGASGFRDMFFVDSLKGWKAYDSVKMTTNGGINWQTQILPSGLGIATLFSTTFSHINADTIWLGGGRIIFPNSQARGMIFRTINQGSNWLFQIPDTAIVAGIYSHVRFVDKYKGWANTGFVQIHTTAGGDPVWLTPVHQISSEVPQEYMLFQNYPNPFNPKTNIIYSVKPNVKSQNAKIELIVYDVTGRKVTTLVNEEHSAGMYEVEFNGSDFSSGIYFYSLIIEGKIIDTKKMILIK